MILSNKNTSGMIFRGLVIIILLQFSNLYAQNRKDITLEDIWQKGTFRPEYSEGFNWMKDDHYFTRLDYTSGETPELVKYDVINATPVETLLKNSDLTYKGNPIAIEDYSFSPDEKRILISENVQHIYRRSKKGTYYIYDIISKKITLLSEGALSNVSFSPDSRMAAFTRDNNLFYVDLSTMKETAITNDGVFNKIINGSTDWVYEEEFEFTKAYFWSPDSRKIAYYRFDESQVKEYNMQLWKGLYPQDYRFKYPKAGEKNSEVSVKIYNVASAGLKDVDLGKEADIYIPRMKWSEDNRLAVFKMNRYQNELNILLVSDNATDIKTIYTEKNNTYIEINDDLNFLKDRKHFIISSERDGFRHLYKYDLAGKQVAQITKGNWELSKFLGIDESKGLVYFTSAEVSPLERYLYCIDLDGKNKKRLSGEKGTHEVEMSSDFHYYLDNFSDANTPTTTSLLEASGKKVKTLTSNEVLKNRISEYKISKVEFFQFNTPDKISLNGWMIKPAGFDVSKKYPVMLTVYGGPGSQSVTDEWEGMNYFWYQMLAQKGYIVVSIDNRGTGGRGADFKKITQNQLGKFETQDMINTAVYLSGLPYIDKSRIGIFGWSFGGYMASLAITVGADYFKADIAV
ncbi:MAG TPA: DPP IV N-terminal domain-containing protein, partial [Cytophagaceae bacterium]|nr:DPP IV N-terminal domain-containing protein [Cytophagaceae bacterium]